jgi:hypothetical protein
MFLENSPALLKNNSLFFSGVAVKIVLINDI